MPTRRGRPKARVTYRRTSGRDLPVLVEHRHRMWSEIGGRTEDEIAEHDARYRPWARRRLRSGELVGVVAEREDGTPVASGLVWFRPDQPRPRLSRLESPYILSMFTEPAWRGRGVATRVVRELLRVCRERGLPNAGLHASRLGRGVYRRLGFERTWEMRIWLDPRYAPRQPSARGRRKGRKGLGRGR